MVSISHLEMEKTLQALLDTHPLTRTLGMNNLEEMIWRQSDMCFFTSSKALCHGKDSQADQSRRNMPTLRKRRKKSALKSFAATNPTNSRNSCTTVEVCPSHRTLITATSSDFSRGA